jgi:mRNA-degrading endonuclease toxin of MazEF toxin-antitoxin module
MKQTATALTDLQRGDVWLTRFGAGRHGEPTRNRPAVIVSEQAVTAEGPGGMVVLVPVSTAFRPSALRPRLAVGEGVEAASIANCVAAHGVNRSHLLRRLGEVEPRTLSSIEDALAIILGLDLR